MSLEVYNKIVEGNLPQFYLSENAFLKHSGLQTFIKVNLKIFMKNHTHKESLS